MKGCCLEYLQPSTYLCKKEDNWLEKLTKETMSISSQKILNNQ